LNNLKTKSSDDLKSNEIFYKGFIMKFIKNFFLTIGLFLGLTISSFGAITLPAKLDVSPIESLAGLILGALAIIWVVRKVIAFMGR
jgi:hypothetical protein